MDQQQSRQQGIQSASGKQPSRRKPRHGTSYAQLIAQAIGASADQRLTLSEIYKWMIEHVPSIQQRASSSAWRNSVRHNLSVHRRFVRVASDLAGRSSWWTIAPGVQAAKPRRSSQPNKDSPALSEPSQPARDCTFTRFDSFLDDLNQIICKEMPALKQIQLERL